MRLILGVLTVDRWEHATSSSSDRACDAVLGPHLQHDVNGSLLSDCCYKLSRLIHRRRRTF